jgi:phage-related baseplate assembly protein
MPPLFDYDLSIVPDIDFAEKDASIIQSQVINDYESYFALITRIQKTLGRADPVRLFLLSIIYQLIVQRGIVDVTGKNNLIKYARQEFLDNIGARWGPTRGKRLDAKKASCILRFGLSAIMRIETVIPLGTQAQSNSGIIFETIKEAIIPARWQTVDVVAEAVEPGAFANGLLAGQITQLVSWSAPYLVTVINLDTTSGGAEIETDDRFRMRIWMAPESFSVAGPYGAYEYWAASANSNISNVSVWSDAANAGKVYIYFLMESGRLPTDEERQQVYDICSADDIRPLTDQVFVEVPIIVVVLVVASFWIEDSKAAFAEDIRTNVYTAWEEYRVWQSEEIGRDINPSKLVQMLINAGAKRVVVDSPLFTDPNNFINKQSVANLDAASTLTYAGLETKVVADFQLPTLGG